MIETILTYLKTKIKTVLITVGILFFLVVVFTVKDHIRAWWWQGKTEVVMPKPVDYSVDRDRLECIFNRTSDEILDLCTKAYGPDGRPAKR